jgi:hypothetical protein
MKSIAFCALIALVLFLLALAFITGGSNILGLLLIVVGAMFAVTALSGTFRL